MRRRRRNPECRRGLTLLELLIAVSITTLAGLALSTVMTTVARSITGATDARSALQRAHAAYARIRAFTGPGFCLLQHDASKGFALWLNDNKAGNTVNLREYRVFWHDKGTGEITAERVHFPDEWPAELQEEFDLVLSPGSDFLLEMEAQRALGYTKTETICDGVLQCALAHGAPTIEAATNFTLTFSMDDASEQPPDILTAYAFFNHMEPR